MLMQGQGPRPVDPLPISQDGGSLQAIVLSPTPELVTASTNSDPPQGELHAELSGPCSPCLELLPSITDSGQVNSTQL